MPSSLSYTPTRSLFHTDQTISQKYQIIYGIFSPRLFFPPFLFFEFSSLLYWYIPSILIFTYPFVCVCVVCVFIVGGGNGTGVYRLHASHRRITSRPVLGHHFLPDASSPRCRIANRNTGGRHRHRLWYSNLPRRSQRSRLRCALKKIQFNDLTA